MTNDKEDATEAVPGSTAAALANAATICNEVIAATGNNNETTKDNATAKAKVHSKSSIPPDATRELVVGNKKQVNGRLC